MCSPRSRPRHVTCDPERAGTAGATSGDVALLHEAVCEKRVGWHLLVFGSHGQYESQASGHCKRLERMRKRGLLDTCVNASLTSVPREWAAAHGEHHVATRRGGRPFLSRAAAAHARRLRASSCRRRRREGRRKRAAEAQ